MRIPEGFLLSGIHCGIKRKNPDLGMIYIQGQGRAFGVFTKNSNPSYSVTLSKRNINNPVSAVLVNSGNANCHSHSTGLKDTEGLISQLAGHIGTKKENILIASTGIIGKRLPKGVIKKSIPSLVKNLTDQGDDFARSILTTDTRTKTASCCLRAQKNIVTVSGFAKGAGMICPDMATMLAFIITDAHLPAGVLRRYTKEAVKKSFNSITIDGCMSTNDSVFVLSSRRVSLKKTAELKLFYEALFEVCLNLAKEIVKDAEGATKFIEISIEGARSEDEAKKAAFYLANSNLVKSALYGANANWGRIVAALGAAGIAVGENVKIKAGDLKKKNIIVTVDLKRGGAKWKVYTSDLTPEYVNINAHYS